MQKVASTLKEIISPNQIDSADGGNEVDSLKKCESNNVIMNIIGNYLDISDYNISNIGTEYESDEHPDIQKVASTSSQIDSVSEVKQNYSSKKYGLSSKSSKETMNLNNDLDINNYSISNIGSRTGSQNHSLDKIEVEDSSSIVS